MRAHRYPLFGVPSDPPRRRSRTNDGAPEVAASARAGLTVWQRAVKRAIDIVGALVFFVCFGFLYALVACAVFASHAGSVHFRQTRLGRDGRAFRLYKFRSMVADSGAMLERHLVDDPAARTQWDTFQKLDRDPRITRVGRVIRKLSLDELPQFFNVLKGDMSLVGPRPCMVRQRSLYGGHWDHYCRVRPGLTGLWQVSGRNRLSYRERVALDEKYATEWSLWLDIRILARTFGVVWRGEGS